MGLIFGVRRTGAGIRCCGSGCWFRRTGRSGRGWGRSTRRRRRRRLNMTRSVICAPGNVRAEGHRNPAYAETFVFDNDYPAMLPNVSPSEVEKEGLIFGRVERGICRVVCFSPRHDLTIPQMEQEEVRRVVEVWTQQYQQLGDVAWVKHVQIFENRGVLMGASNPHPHCQIWANEEVPNVPMREQAAMREFLESNEKCLLCEYLRLEVEDGERIVCENEGFVALVPYWAVWPFETMILSRRHLASIAALEDTEPRDLADILRRLTIRYDNLFETAFPYSMGFHQEPTDGESHPEFHFHAHYFPAAAAIGRGAEIHGGL